jgi:hypothetical protein
VNVSAASKTSISTATISGGKGSFTVAPNFAEELSELLRENRELKEALNNASKNNEECRKEFPVECLLCSKSKTAESIP